MSSSHRKQNGVIDWQEVRERLARGASATDDAMRLTPERARAVLDERARLLARVPSEAIPAAAMMEVVTFALASERYAIESRHVREVIRLTDLTPLPGAPPFLAGVCNLRGQILAVVDPGKLFGLPEKGLTDLTRVLVLGGEHAEFGMLIDSAPGVSRLRADEVLEPPGSVTGTARAHLRGVTADALLVLDGAALLLDPHLYIDQGDAEA